MQIICMYTYDPFSFLFNYSRLIINASSKYENNLKLKVPILPSINKF